ncbi:hypothetical protein [Flavobacterium agrisoli]|uniref:Lipoprotein n=1 Tax=Flavobacterium agrisoli TaxID=2793066 RepID=A0A934PKW0_9FLAO|nr:hypothetical protein [Flavobacterium agrisoli]MBK0370047.1 hypothetical protein [Flavobacterium agrisoli]
MQKLLFALGLCLLISCAQHTENNTEYYRAIHQQDTAYLTISRVENQFYGQYEIHYNGQAFIDSGAVSGIIKKDTLRGNFEYFPYGGGQKKRKPVIFLEKNNQLLLGKGLTYTLFQITYFDESVPFDFSKPEFVFERVSK